MEITNMPKDNLVNTFNCGVGLVIAVSESDEEDALGILNQSYFAKTIGRVEERKVNEEAISFV
jgi:phosphoribosylaminoimidazole (AIR) synthetase